MWHCQSISPGCVDWGDTTSLCTGDTHGKTTQVIQIVITLSLVSCDLCWPSVIIAHRQASVGQRPLQAGYLLSHDIHDSHKTGQQFGFLPGGEFLLGLLLAAGFLGALRCHSSQPRPDSPAPHRNTQRPATVNNNNTAGTDTQLTPHDRYWPTMTRPRALVDSIGWLDAAAQWSRFLLVTSAAWPESCVGRVVLVREGGVSTGNGAPPSQYMYII